MLVRDGDEIYKSGDEEDDDLMGEGGKGEGESDYKGIEVAPETRK